MEIEVTAPNRIDLAGGTTDIYPLYLFMGHGCTVNVAVDVYSRVTISTVKGSGVRVVSEDLGEEVEARIPSDLPVTGPLGLVGRAVHAFPPSRGTLIVTRNSAPAGSGLGASSALLVAAIAGLMKNRGEEPSRRDLVNIAAAIETSAITVPTGKQDHIAAVYGGVSLIDFGYTDFNRSYVPNDADRLDPLEERMILSYTGEGRFSGMNNWSITKGFVENQGGIREKLTRIRNVADELYMALLAGDYEAVPALVDQEWQIRRTLAPGISTPRIDAIMSAAATAGASASKICGAGGGGCMVTFAEPQRRPTVVQAIEEAGGTVMPYTIATRGVSWKARKRY